MRRVKEKRFLLVGLAEILLVLFLLPGCFRRSEQIDCAVGDQITLTPGVYELHVGTALKEGQSITVELQSKEAYYRALRTNAVTFDFNRQNMVVHAWVTNLITDATVQCDYTDAGSENLTELALFRTAKGDRIRLFKVVFCLFFLDGVLILRIRILDGTMTLKQQRVFWILAAGVLIACFPYLTDYFSISDKTVYYMKKILGYGERSFADRIQESISHESMFLGIPVWLTWLGFPLMTAYKMWVVLTVILTTVISYRMLMLCVREEYAAVTGSMFYLLMPHYAAGIYERGDIEEAHLTAFLPLLVLGIYMLVTDAQKEKVKKYLCCTAVGVLTVGSSLLLVEPGTGNYSRLELGSGAVLLVLGYAVWKLREKSGIPKECRLWFLCSVFTGVMACLLLPGRWMLLAELAVAVFAATFCVEIQRTKSTLGRWVFGLAAVVAICSAVYHGNRIAYTSEAVYLYEAQNMGNLSQTEFPVESTGGVQW